MANFFKGYGRDAYAKKNEGKTVEDLTATINRREGTKTPDPSIRRSEKTLTKKQKERIQNQDSF